VLAAINMCRSLALGARGSIPGSPAAMSAMRDIALRMGEARAAHERLFTEQAMQFAEQAHAAALNAISRRACVPADIS